MNLKNFKLKSESEDSFHIENPHGRVFTVMKKELHPKAHAEIIKLADGGNVPAQDPMSVLEEANKNDMPNDVASGVQPGSEQAANQAFASAGMNPTQGAADQYQQAKADFDAAQAAAQKNNDVSSQQDLQRAKENLQNATSNLSTVAQQQAGTPSPQNTLMPQGQMPPQTQQGNQQQAQNQAPQQPDYLSQMGQARENALNAEEKGAQDLSDTLQKSIGQQQQSYQDLINQQKGMKTPQQIADEYKAKDAAFMQQMMNSKIDPSRYFHNMSTGQKIASAIALTFGGGLNGRNIAAEQLNKAVDNDIAAQQNDQSKAMNLWRMNRENMHSDIEASVATKNQLLSLAQTKLAMAGANVQNAQARLNAQQMISQIEQQKINNRMLLSSGGSGPAGGPSSGAVNYNKFNAMQRAGIMNPADVTAATKEANDVEAVRALRSEYIDSFKKLSSMTAAGALSPNQREGLINALAAKIAKQSAGRFNLEESQQIVKGMFPSKTDVGHDTTNIKFNKGLGYFNAEEAGASTLKRYGLLNPAPAASLSQEGATGTYQGKPVIMRNGQWVYR